MRHLNTGAVWGFLILTNDSNLYPRAFFFTATHIGTVCIFHEHSNTEDCYRKALNTVQMAEIQALTRYPKLQKEVETLLFKVLSFVTLPNYTSYI